MRSPLVALALALVFSFPALGDKPDKHKAVPPGLAKKGGAPPGLAKKGGIPPGLAKKGGLPPGLGKKFGPRVPDRAYIAFDSRFQDRAWFLIEDRWVLRSRFEPSVRVEVRHAFSLPPVPPPVPLPSGSLNLHVVLFQ